MPLFGMVLLARLLPVEGHMHLPDLSEDPAKDSKVASKSYAVVAVTSKCLTSVKVVLIIHLVSISRTTS